MNEKKLDWEDLQLFLAVARSGGLSAAVRDAQRSAPTLGRRMQALERYLGQELFVRHDRGYALTPAGSRLLEQLAELEPRLARLTQPRQDTARPLVKISAGTWTTLALLERLDEIAGSPVDVRLRFVAAENVLNIMHREVVIGFRNQRPTEDALAARKLSRVEFAAYARPGAPDVWIRAMADVPSARWLDRIVGDTAFCEVNNPRNSLDLALAGHGKALLPTFIGERQKELRRSGPAIPELAHDQWMVTHQDDRQLPEVRRVIDRCVRALEPRQ